MTSKAPVNQVLIVEDLAHRPLGHLPNRFAELADGFRDLGIPVEVLTSRGWARSGQQSANWPLHTYGQFPLALARAAFLLEARAYRRSAPQPRIAAALRTAAALLAASRQASRMDRASPGDRTGIVLLNLGSSPGLLAHVVRRPWLVHVFDRRDAAAARRRRIRARRPVCVALPSEAWLDDTQGGLRTALVRLAGTRHPPTPVADARAELGVSPGRRVALLFGTDHRHHDPGPVVDALAGSTDWQLVAMGTVCTPFLRRCDGLPTAWTNPPVVVPGHVDDHQRDLAYLAADVVVLSFTPGYRLNSGTLMDALSCGKPVIVSDQSLASEVVARHRIGEVFVAGDHVSLTAALDRLSRLLGADHQVDPALRDRLNAAREHFGNRSIADVHLEVLRRLTDPHDELADCRLGLRP